MAYTDPKTGKTVTLQGDPGAQNLEANKRGLDYVPDTKPTVPESAYGGQKPGAFDASKVTPVTDSSAVRRDVAAAGGADAVGPKPFKAQTYDEFKASMGETTTPPPTQPSQVDQYAKLRADQGISAIEDSIGQYEGEKADLLSAAEKFKRGATAGYSEATAGARISEEERNIQDRLDFIGRQEALAQGKLTIKNNYIQSIMGYTKDDYATARQNYEYEFNKNIQMQNAYTSAVNKDLTLDEKQKNDARATITSMWNMAKDTVGRDPKALDDYFAKHGNDLNQLELLAGEPIGSTEAFLRAKPNATILSKGTGVNPATGNMASWFVTIDPVSGQPTTSYVDTGTKYRPTAAITKASTAQEISDHFDSIAGDDGYVDPQAFIDARANSSLTPTEFNNRFGDYVNPASYSQVKLKPLSAAKAAGGDTAAMISAIRDKKTTQ